MSASESETPPPARDGASKTISGQPIKGQSSDRITYPARDNTVPYGDVLECVMACAGSKHCAWRPYECKLVNGGAA